MRAADCSGHAIPSKRLEFIQQFRPFFTGDLINHDINAVLTEYFNNVVVSVQYLISAKANYFVRL